MAESKCSMISNPKTPVERLLWAYPFGHAWSRDPKYVNLRNLDSGRIALMTGDEADAKLLIASFQDFDPNVERLVTAFHGRALNVDGDVGPATAAVMNFKRCAMPDFAPPAGAELRMYDDIEGLAGAVESYQRYAAARNNDAEYVGGSGSWPKCDPQRQDVHSTRMNVIRSGFSSQQREQWPEVAEAMSRCSAEVGLSTRIVFDGDPEDCEHDVRGQNIPGNVIGFAYFPEPDTCNQVVVARIDNSFDVDKFTFGELNEHEEGGHSRGHEHQNRRSNEQGNPGYSIMHPSIGRPTRWMSWVKDLGFARMQRWFGGVPIPGADPVPTPDPTPTGRKVKMRAASVGGFGVLEVVAESSFTVKAGDVLGQFHPVPMPEA